jgi:hypothetical protein
MIVFGPRDRVGKTAQRYLLDSQVGNCLNPLEKRHAEKQILEKSSIILCTIASTSLLMRKWEEIYGEVLRVHTVIVDECGCTPESSTALLLRLRPSNLVLVGDHKQLPPTSDIPQHKLRGTGHDRSLLERCVDASDQVHLLKEQYRMHPKIASLVSRLSYNGQLSTPQRVKELRKCEDRPLVWLDVEGEEVSDGSCMNTAEVTKCVQACATLREQVQHGASIAVLSFYRAQVDALKRAMPTSLRVEVSTVDAWQGNECDYLVVSTVKANGGIGFLSKVQRINVAISRAKFKLVFVGHRPTLIQDKKWQQVANACSPAKPQEFLPSSSLPSSFESVFDKERADKSREAQQKRIAILEEANADRRRVSAEVVIPQQLPSTIGTHWGDVRPDPLLFDFHLQQHYCYLHGSIWHQLHGFPEQHFPVWPWPPMGPPVPFAWELQWRLAGGTHAPLATEVEEPEEQGGQLRIPPATLKNRPIRKSDSLSSKPLLN